MQRRLRRVALVLAVLALAGGAQALGAAPRLHRDQRGLSRAQIQRDARATHRVIVVLKSQQRGRLSSAFAVRARRAAEERQRRPLIARLTASGLSVTRQFTVTERLRRDGLRRGAEAPGGEPERRRRHPRREGDAGPGSGGVGREPGRRQRLDPGNPTTPQTGICPTDPSKPLLEPEALQTMHVAYNDPTIPQAANLATGAGVKVAFFADGVDINNPDFIRPDGSHVFIDYRDFTGDGPNAPSGAAEAFGDASSVAAQGRQVYDLSTFVNPAHPLPPGCNIRVRGVAPGASLIGMKVFGEGGSFTSVIIQGLDWAVTHDHADILSESFGGYAMPDTAVDADQAVQRRRGPLRGHRDPGHQRRGRHRGPDVARHRPERHRHRRPRRTSARTRRRPSYAFQFARTARG